MAMLPVVAVTVIVPTPVVVRSPDALWVTPVPPVRLMSPVVELIAALTVSSPPVATRVTSPDPCAEIAPLTVKAPAAVRMSMFPLPRLVVAAETISPFVSAMKMSPDVLFVAERVPMVVSMFPEPETPIPVAAESVAVAVDVMFAVSAPVMSVMLPAVAVSPMVLLVVVISARTMLAAAIS